jgi:hypothetical protein
VRDGVESAFKRVRLFIQPIHIETPPDMLITLFFNDLMIVPSPRLKLSSFVFRTSTVSTSTGLFEFAGSGTCAVESHLAPDITPTLLTYSIKNTVRPKFGATTNLYSLIIAMAM